MISHVYVYVYICICTCICICKCICRCMCICICICICIYVCVTYVFFSFSCKPLVELGRCFAVKTVLPAAKGFIAPTDTAKTYDTYLIARFMGPTWGPMNFAILDAICWLCLEAILGYCGIWLVFGNMSFVSYIMLSEEVELLDLWNVRVIENHIDKFWLQCSGSRY